MINSITSTLVLSLGRGIIYGGFVRDYFCRYDLNFNDIDIKFNDEDALNSFVLQLSDLYSITFIEPFGVSLPKQQKPCFSKEYEAICIHSINSNTNEGKYDDAIIKTIRIEHIDGVSIQMDLTLKQEIKQSKDFDVNTLEWKSGHLLNEKLQHTKDIVGRIKRKEFIVLTPQGESLLVHQVYCFFKCIYEINIAKYSCSNTHCFCRHSSKGKKLQLRIEKMQKRGWVMLNKPCENPMCILSPDEDYVKYVAEMLDKYRQIFERKQKQDELIEFNRSLTKKYYKRLILMNEIKILEKPYKFALNDKERAIVTFDKKPSKKGKFKPILKFNSKCYRKETVNKKLVFIEYDDCKLARKMEYLDEEEDVNT